MSFNQVVMPHMYGEPGVRLGRVADQIAPNTRRFLLPSSRFEDMTVCEGSDGALLVTEGRPPAVHDFHVLLTQGVPSLKFGEDRSIMVPYGKGRSGIRAAKVGIALARELGLPVVFYHATWLNEGLQSDDPMDHMCDEARANMARLREMANDAQTQCRFVTVTESQADTINGGIVDAALEHDATLIVMAYGRGVRLNPFANLVADTSPVPILIVPSLREGAA